MRKKLLILLFLFFIFYPKLQADPVTIHYTKSYGLYGISVKKVYVYEKHNNIWKVRFEGDTVTIYIGIRGFDLYDAQGHKVRS